MEMENSEKNNPFICFFCGCDLSGKIAEKTKNQKTTLPFMAYFCGKCTKTKTDDLRS